jgi:two-component system, chemotaxis family, chemotaxis protein CheY
VRPFFQLEESFLKKRVLDIGQCGFDHRAIARLLESRFGAEAVPCEGLDDALACLRERAFDLVLINRRLDSDGSDGLDVLAAIRAERLWDAIPVMLVTNYPEHQARAVEQGAVAGFGKGALKAPATAQLLARYLG